MYTLVEYRFLRPLFTAFKSFGCCFLYNFALQYRIRKLKCKLIRICILSLLYNLFLSWPPLSLNLPTVKVAEKYHYESTLFRPWNSRSKYLIAFLCSFLTAMYIFYQPKWTLFLHAAFIFCNLYWLFYMFTTK